MDSSLIDKIKFDCRYFDAVKPCKPHKELGVFCDDCEYYYKTDKRILVIKFGSMGDVVRTTAILPGLRKEYPFAHITWITAPNAVDIFKNNPMVDKIMSDPSEYLPMLASVTFDLVLNLETDLRSSALATRSQGLEKRGYYFASEGVAKPLNKSAEEWYLLGVNDKLKKANTKTYFEHLYNIAGLMYERQKPQIFLTDSESLFTKKFAGHNDLKRKKHVIGINTGSGKRWPLKKWTVKNYAALINTLARLYPALGIVVFGGPEEVEFNKTLFEKVGSNAVNAGTQNNMREFFSLINSVDILFTPDSLALHVGVALEKSVIVYTGPTSYTELDVFNKGKVIHSEIDCLVCYLNECSKDPNCMNSLSVDFVLNTLKFYIEQK